MDRGELGPTLNWLRIGFAPAIVLDTYGPGRALCLPRTLRGVGWTR